MAVREREQEVEEERRVKEKAERAREEVERAREEAERAREEAERAKEEAEGKHQVNPSYYDYITSVKVLINGHVVNEAIAMLPKD